jgi:hypothetical protein
MDGQEDEPAESELEQDPNRFKHLPKRVSPEDMVETTDTHVARDPESGRDTDRDFMIRYSGS